MSAQSLARRALKKAGNSTVLAAALGVTSRAVEHWVTGARSPRRQYRAALVQYLNGKTK